MSSWNTNFSDALTNNISKQPRDARLQYDNYGIKNMKVSIYSL